MTSTHTNGNASLKHNTEHNKDKRHDLGMDFQDLSKATSTLATDAANMVQEKASEYYDQGMNEVKRFEKGLESRIQNKPIQSLLIVAGIGLVLGALWNRR
ncbi:MAG: hypothetical protein HQM16_03630 [Deltaproteobacteria bacterium]|nr:hypothetical protein [Deltaproteobacteria bacterium]